MARSVNSGWRFAAAAGLCLTVLTCKRPDRAATNALAASLIFDSPSSDAREAMTASVPFTITADNFARWEQATANLEQLPPSSIRSATGSKRTAIDRAVSRLESSPRARRAIESTGLSVRDFVLETIALAQATESVQTGRTTSPTPVIAENTEFVRQYRSGSLQAAVADAPPDFAPPDCEISPEASMPPEVPMSPDIAWPPDVPMPSEVPTAQMAPTVPPMPADSPDDALDMREQLAAELSRQAEMTMQTRMAEGATRAARVRSQREMRRLQEQVRREMSALMRRHYSRANQLREPR